MKPYYADPTVRIFHGDCLGVLRELPDVSVDAVVTDPPYGLGFMGKEWDKIKQEASRPPSADVTDERFNHKFPRTGKGPAATAFDGVGFQAWCLEWTAECLRVLKPGGHMLAFGGTRTSHRLACAVEDAGFEIRDSIAWLYGSGFPKSLDVSKAIDKAAGVEREVVGRRAARTWQGWGTALKPAHEPIVVARKPLAGTVAANVQAHGTGALNVDGCRIAASDPEQYARNVEPWTKWERGGSVLEESKGMHTPGRVAPHTDTTAGRWPANVVLDESQAAALDAQSGELTSGANPTRRGSDKFRDAYGDFTGQEECEPARGADSGGASRFMYVAKAAADERVRVDGTAHPTVKPLALMRWLVRLVTPPGGTVLEPFAGSGTTVEACILEGFACIAIEREADYLPLIRQRIHRRRDPVEAVRGSGEDAGLFDLLGGEGA